MSTKKAGGTAKNNRDSQAKRRGVKVFGKQQVKAGNIIVRQKGTKYQVGQNVGLGKDFTIFATKAGKVEFTEKKFKKYDGRIYKKTVVNVC